MNTFKHFGDRGDIIAGLPVIRHFGGGLLYIEASTYTREMLTPDKWCGLDRILKAQPYISDVQPWNRQSVSYNLNDWRAKLFKAVRIGTHKDKSLVDWQLEQFGIPLTAKDTAWLTIEPRKIARVVFNRTGTGRSQHHVYHNPDFPWHYVWSKYKKNAVFVGLPEEHEVFCATCGQIPHVQTKDLYEAAQVISGCDLFVGNQSCCFWLAEGMKKRIVLEVWKAGPNCLIPRPGVVHGWDRKVELPDL